ncbi:BH3-interacting domain death agonist-like isoform X3 [Polypterus senegalus]|uniref:BH3-interacting domain death agonist-like isoform X3 n=1 Tax=Polypterus senegalus TaxID=55291 RepID=UPI001966A17A|nr:BH3-interacting domain death agonist-like isoform X3 [Polypterus senegalus]
MGKLLVKVLLPSFKDHSKTCLKELFHVSLLKFALEWKIIRRANAANEEALREIARHLADIADHLDQRMIAEAAQNLSQHMQSVNLRQDWVGLLSTEIQNFMRHGIPGLQYANEERVMVALTMALVKRIGLQFPTLLRSFFSTAVQYINENIQTQINQT